ncbi:CYTH domain-containing protein [Thiohalophilus thiocyanatoxydans]|uniref:Adenylate cyclase n=1 Tax=Thiohalophilus thiocyanatoxydans TaxID=381308 RepID=A0A4R8IQ14_9GAMM|nr:CYTH domain-containing protein [Thiohalophilus thiocyanatoxydans]TDY02976.1 adenylate cyclase [Thiohalophilus thiocyanatoxydans]
MATEIERKFLIRDDRWRQQADAGQRIAQGYLIGARDASVRVRIEGDQANLNIKSATLGIYRQEYEYSIPLEDAREMLDNLCEKPIIDKVRYHVSHAGHLWEIDVFEGENVGLVVAEIELDSEDEAFEQPDWLGQEVSDDARYYNVSLVNHPYKDWQ